MSGQGTGGRVTDADYFAAVDDFLQRQEDLQAAKERREEQRYAYPAKAMIAFCREGQIPPINWFESVMCRDISSKGFAFFYPETPRQDHLIVIFRRKSDYVSVFSRVANAHTVDQDGQRMYAVGCEFISRVDDASDE